MFKMWGTDQVDEPEESSDETGAGAKAGVVIGRITVPGVVDVEDEELSSEESESGGGAVVVVVVDEAAAGVVDEVEGVEDATCTVVLSVEGEVFEVFTEEVVDAVLVAAVFEIEVDEASDGVDVACVVEDVSVKVADEVVVDVSPRVITGDAGSVGVVVVVAAGGVTGVATESVELAATHFPIVFTRAPSVIRTQ